MSTVVLRRAAVTECNSTHCELFGDPPATSATLNSANNFFNGKELPNADAVLAVLHVEGRDWNAGHKDLPAKPVCVTK